MKCLSRLAFLVFVSILIAGSPTVSHAQVDPTAVSHTVDLKTVVVATDAKSDSVIAVPPATSGTIDLRGARHVSAAESVDLPSWLGREAALNGLQSTDLRPWHIVVTYDQFDEGGDNVHRGV
jgi:hypothetical protein